MIINKIFPTLVGYKENVFIQKDLDKILERIYFIKKSIKEEKSFWLSGEKSPYNTINSYNMARDKNFLFFIEEINQNVIEFSKEFNDNREYLCSSSWFNIYNNQNYQEPHSHLNSVYSAVFFPKAPKGSGKIVFQNPSIHEMSPDEDSYASYPNWFFEPKDNMLLIFRSNLRHFVLQGNNDEDRISIAMNYIIDPKFYFEKNNITEYNFVYEV